MKDWFEPALFKMSGFPAASSQPQPPQEVSSFVNLLSYHICPGCKEIYPSYFELLKHCVASELCSKPKIGELTSVSEECTRAIINSGTESDLLNFLEHWFMNKNDLPVPDSPFEDVESIEAEADVDFNLSSSTQNFNENDVEKEMLPFAPLDSIKELKNNIIHENSINLNETKTLEVDEEHFEIEKENIPVITTAIKSITKFNQRQKTRRITYKADSNSHTGSEDESEIEKRKPTTKYNLRQKTGRITYKADSNSHTGSEDESEIEIKKRKSTTKYNLRQKTGRITYKVDSNSESEDEFETRSRLRSKILKKTWKIQSKPKNKKTAVKIRTHKYKQMPSELKPTPFLCFYCEKMFLFYEIFWNHIKCHEKNEQDL